MADSPPTPEVELGNSGATANNNIARPAAVNPSQNTTASSEAPRRRTAWVFGRVYDFDCTYRRPDTRKIPVLSSSSSSSEDEDDQNGGATDNSGRPKSPPPNCAICLGRCKNKCFTDSCMHQFCFKCLCEWSKVKPECPLCKQSFEKIIHNVKSDNQFDEYLIQQNPPMPVPNRPFQVSFRNLTHIFPEDFRLPNWDNPQILSRNGRTYFYRALRTNNLTRSAPSAPMYDDSGRRIVNDRFYERELYGIYHQEYPTDLSVDALRLRVIFRRLIYTKNLYAMPVSDITGSFRETSARFYRENPSQVRRVSTFINREVRALLRDTPEREMTTLKGLIRQNLPLMNILSPAFRRLLIPHLGERTPHFIHEIHNFARSPFDMVGYDEVVQYTEVSSEEIVEFSSSGSSNEETVASTTNSSTTNSGSTRRTRRRANTISVVAVPPTTGLNRLGDYEDITIEPAQQNAANVINLDISNLSDGTEVSGVSPGAQIAAINLSTHNRLSEPVVIDSDDTDSDVTSNTSSDLTSSTSTSSGTVEEVLNLSSGSNQLSSGESVIIVNSQAASSPPLLENEEVIVERANDPAEVQEVPDSPLNNPQNTAQESPEVPQGSSQVSGGGDGGDVGGEETPEDVVDMVIRMMMEAVHPDNMEENPSSQAESELDSSFASTSTATTSSSTTLSSALSSLSDETLTNVQTEENSRNENATNNGSAEPIADELTLRENLETVQEAGDLPAEPLMASPPIDDLGESIYEFLQNMTNYSNSQDVRPSTSQQVAEGSTSTENLRRPSKESAPVRGAANSRSSERIISSALDYVPAVDLTNQPDYIPPPIHPAFQASSDINAYTSVIQRNHSSHPTPVVTANIELNTSSSDECEFVLARRPPHLRTPEEMVSLNSTSDSDCVFVAEIKQELKKTSFKSSDEENALDKPEPATNISAVSYDNFEGFDQDGPSTSSGLRSRCRNKTPAAKENKSVETRGSKRRRSTRRKTASRRLLESERCNLSLSTDSESESDFEKSLHKRSKRSGQANRKSQKKSSHHSRKTKKTQRKTKDREGDEKERRGGRAAGESSKRKNAGKSSSSDSNESNDEDGLPLHHLKKRLRSQQIENGGNDAEANGSGLEENLQDPQRSANSNLPSEEKPSSSFFGFPSIPRRFSIGRPSGGHVELNLSDSDAPNINPDDFKPIADIAFKNILALAAAVPPNSDSDSDSAHRPTNVPFKNASTSSYTLVERPKRKAKPKSSNTVASNRNEDTNLSHFSFDSRNSNDSKDALPNLPIESNLTENSQNAEEQEEEEDSHLSEDSEDSDDSQTSKSSEVSNSSKSSSSSHHSNNSQDDDAKSKDTSENSSDSDTSNGNDDDDPEEEAEEKPDVKKEHDPEDEQKCLLSQDLNLPSCSTSSLAKDFKSLELESSQQNNIKNKLLQDEAVNGKGNGAGTGTGNGNGNETDSSQASCYLYPQWLKKKQELEEKKALAERLKNETRPVRVQRRRCPRDRLPFGSVVVERVFVKSKSGSKRKTENGRSRSEAPNEETKGPCSGTACRIVNNQHIPLIEPVTNDDSNSSTTKTLSFVSVMQAELAEADQRAAAEEERKKQSAAKKVFALRSISEDSNDAFYFR